MPLPGTRFDSTEHRPWPVPRRPWALHMCWHDLLFLHWPVHADLLRMHLPPGLELDTFDGSAWLGVVPFVMSGVRPHCVPPLPGISSFPEINLRTYVTAGGKAGVWFFSLDVTNRLAVFLARRAFHLPYYRARMRVERGRDEVQYSSSRVDSPATIEFRGRYWPRGKVFRSHPGSIEAWLTERYCLYSVDPRGSVFRGDIHHEPWPLQQADCECAQNTLADALGVRLPATRPLVHFSAKLDVVAWSLRQID